jgi:hypothetical protein
MSQSLTELLHEDPQLQLGVGLNFTHTRQELSIQGVQTDKKQLAVSLRSQF